MAAKNIPKTKKQNAPVSTFTRRLLDWMRLVVCSGIIFIQ